ncbi:hypothetical protein SERLA73DRAFT_189309, partial [Serpula lacrymans var. lacrymans S7.3]
MENTNIPINLFTDQSEVTSMMVDGDGNNNDGRQQSQNAENMLAGDAGVQGNYNSVSGPTPKTGIQHANVTGQDRVRDAISTSNEYRKGDLSDETPGHPTASQSKSNNVDGHKIVTDDDDGSDDDLYAEVDQKVISMDVDTNTSNHAGGLLHNTVAAENKGSEVFVNLDMSFSIKGMYRVLDLITEQGSGGLVDKIIIAQDSLQAFVNTISP